jgi:hypothetical protein
MIHLSLKPINNSIEGKREAILQLSSSLYSNNT